MKYTFILGVFFLLLYVFLKYLLGLEITDSSPFIMKLSPSLYLFIIYLVYKKKHFEIFKINAFYVFVLIIAYSSIFARNLYLSGFINAFLIPIILYIIIQNNIVSEKHISIIYKFIFLFFLANSIEAYLERALGYKLILIVDDLSLSDIDVTSFRSNALLGHPLTNGTYTSIFISFVLISKNRLGQKMLTVSFLMLAMFCFNTRFSIVTSILTIFLYSFNYIFYDKTNSIANKFRMFKCIVLVFALGCCIMLFTPLGGRLINIGLYGNDASSLARTDVFDYFNYLSLNDILFGVSDNFFSLLQLKTGMDTLIIENPILVYTFSIGFILTLLLFISQYAMIKRLMLKWKKNEIIVVLLPFYLNLLSNISLAGGAVTVSFLMILIFIYNNKHTVVRL